MSVDLKITSVIAGTQNVLQFTKGGHFQDYGDRIPAISLCGCKQLEITSAVNGDSHYWIRDRKHQRNEDEWINNIQISQQMDTNGRYIYKIQIDGKTIHEVENKRPEMFDNVKVYVSNPWENSSIGIVRNLKAGKSENFGENINFCENVRFYENCTSK